MGRKEEPNVPITSENCTQVSKKIGEKRVVKGRRLRNRETIGPRRARGP